MIYTTNSKLTLSMALSANLLQAWDALSADWLSHFKRKEAFKAEDDTGIWALEQSHES